MKDAARVMTALAGVGVIMVMVAAVVWLPGSGSEPSAPATGSRARQGGSYTVTLHNDTSKDAGFEVFVYDDYMGTLTTIGEILATESATVTVPTGGGQYVFYLDTEVGGEDAYLDASVTEGRLGELDYEFRFFEDDMGLGALDPADWPTAEPTVELITDPTSTYGPGET